MAREVLGTRLFEIGDTPVTVATLITGALILVATVIVSSMLRRGLSRMLLRTRAGERSVGTVTGLLYYLLLVTWFGIAIQTVGIDLSALFAAGALFAVAIGFAMQSITQNFVAGIILLPERTINPGDVLVVEGKMVKVTDMGHRHRLPSTRSAPRRARHRGAQGAQAGRSLRRPNYAWFAERTPERLCLAPHLNGQCSDMKAAIESQSG